MKRLMLGGPDTRCLRSVVCLPPAIAVPAGSTDRLDRDSIGLPRLHVDASTGLVDKVMGRFRPHSSDRYRAAHAFLERHARALGMSPDLADLTTAGRSDDVGGTVLRFAQLHRNVPVRDAFVIVGFDPRGDIHVDNGHVPDLDVPARPPALEGRGGEDREQTLGVRLPSSRTCSSSSRGRQGPPGLSPRLEVAVVERPRGDWQLLVDSQTGAVIRSASTSFSTLVRPVCRPIPRPTTSRRLSLRGALLTRWTTRTLTTGQRRLRAGRLQARQPDEHDKSDGHLCEHLTHAVAARDAPVHVLRSVNERVDEATAYYHVNRSKEYLNLLGFPDVVNHSVGVKAADPNLDNLFLSAGQVRFVRHGRGGRRAGPRHRLPRARPRHPGRSDTGLPASPPSAAWAIRALWVRASAITGRRR